ncbi:tRNA-splicing endonuclease subunit Sen54 isoform X2 [Nelusetta ayraudi]|uniref:tRNA-splicing endonuclease subunit Sen54 isoform X2 n=1 Tax=Nelusetta ayraudi TaxID=303726 RepID=UPI003F6FD911
MADQNKAEIDGKFYSEILSPSELFAARSRSHKLPVKGQKDFIPDGSEEQRRRLDQSLSEHWSLISEERVERLGNLVKAKWIPAERIVELQSPAGKFWQTMGFSANGKQLLQPEEALYLMECGNLQVFSQDLPLSIQDGYESFLSSSSVSLQQYQVFGHLKRLGFVVHRFDPSLEPSCYVRQLNLPPSRDRAARQQKRKRSPSPGTTSRSVDQSATRPEHQDSSSADRMEEEEVQEGHRDLSEGHLSSTSSAGPAGRGRSWWQTDTPQDQSDGSAGSSHTHADRRPSFALFPDLGSKERLSSALLPPDPSLLPGGLEVGTCDVASWRKKINLREVKMSSKEREREEDRSRRRWDVNRDRQVLRCRNWAEYRELLSRRERRSRGRQEHLWNHEVTPLHDPRQPISTEELLEKITVTQSTNLLEGASSIKEWDEWRICFSVYQPDTVADFRKSSPGKPYARVCVCSFDGPVPDLRAVKLLTFQSGDVPVVFAVVDCGDLSFYTFKDFQLPTDVYP